VWGVLCGQARAVRSILSSLYARVRQKCQGFRVYFGVFLRIPWLIPLLIVLLGGAVLLLLERPNLEPTPNPPASPVQKTKGGFLALRGEFVIIGKSPDGDSLRFRPDNPKLLAQLKNPSRIRPAADGTVQLRFEGIDAPELHYGDLEQPLGSQSRDALLQSMGFVSVKLENRIVRSASPRTVRGAILSQAAEGNGRPICYVFVGRFADGFSDGARVALNNEILEQSQNIKMLSSGMAYYTVYSSTPQDQREFLRSVSQQAKAKRRGVWARDKSGEFNLRSQADIGVNGQLILPKFFRRASSYLQAVRAKEFKGNLKQWLVWTQQKESQNDKVRIGEVQKRLSDWLEVGGSTVRFTGDILDVVFVD
jgi:endonuclease YncB( thermonuclease family)